MKRWMKRWPAEDGDHSRATWLELAIVYGLFAMPFIAFLVFIVLGHG